MKRIYLAAVFAIVTAAPLAAKTPYIPPSPEKQAAMNENHDRKLAGSRLLEVGQYAAAESDFRRAIEAIPNDPDAYQGLAESLVGQGRKTEALDVYRKVIYGENMFVGGTSGVTRTLLGYVVLLNEAGEWPEAVAVYQKAVASQKYGPLPDPRFQFSPEHPKPALLAASAHIAAGHNASFTGGMSGAIQHDWALGQFQTAVKLEPGWDVARFYEVFGLIWAGRGKESPAAVNRVFDVRPGPVVRAALKAEYGAIGRVDPVTGRNIIPPAAAPAAGKADSHR